MQVVCRLCLANDNVSGSDVIHYIHIYVHEPVVDNMS